MSWCIAVFTVRHLGTSLTISSHPLTSLLGFVYVLQTDTSSSYLAVDSTYTAVVRFRLLARRSGTHCLMISEIRRVVLTVLSSFLRQSCFVFTNVTSALEVFLNVMRYINPRFTYLLTYLQVLVYQVKVQVQVPLPYNQVQVQVCKLEFKKNLNSETITKNKRLCNKMLRDLCTLYLNHVTQNVSKLSSVTTNTCTVVSQVC